MAPFCTYVEQLGGQALPRDEPGVGMGMGRECIGSPYGWFETSCYWSQTRLV